MAQVLSSARAVGELNEEGPPAPSLIQISAAKCLMIAPLTWKAQRERAATTRAALGRRSPRRADGGRRRRRCLEAGSEIPAGARARSGAWRPRHAPRARPARGPAPQRAGRSRDRRRRRGGAPRHGALLRCAARSTGRHRPHRARRAARAGASCTVAASGAGARAHAAGDGQQRRRLAGPVGADEGHDLSLVDGQDRSVAIAVNMRQGMQSRSSSTVNPCSVSHAA